MQNALDVRNNTELLFPVYDTIKGTGANAQYHVIAWVGFHLTGHDESRQHRQRSPAGSRRSCGPVSPLPTATGQPNLGARVVNLVD